MISASIFDQEIEAIGETVSIVVKSSTTYSDWGDSSSTETTTTGIKAIYNVYGNTSISNEEGKLQSSELTFFFKSDQTGIIRGTKITRSNGDEFQISDVRAYAIEGNAMPIEALVEKI